MILQNLAQLTNSLTDLLLHTTPQACMEFFPVLIETRPAYKAFKTQQPALFRQMLDNAVCGIALVAPQALAAVLQTLYTVRVWG